MGGGAQDAAGIAEPGHARLVQQMRVDARDLRRDVGAQTHAAPGDLVDQLEGAQIQIMAAAGFAWMAAFSVFVLVYAPTLLRPRLDGKPG